MDWHLLHGEHRAKQLSDPQVLSRWVYPALSAKCCKLKAKAWGSVGVRVPGGLMVVACFCLHSESVCYLKCGWLMTQGLQLDITELCRPVGGW